MNTRLSQTVTPLPEDLESPRAKLVYLYLATNGTATLTDLQRGLGLKQLTLYSILGTLADRGLVDRTDAGYCCSD
ncbi:MAG: helix-turn-helix domain-containing protein [Haloarculaceae archaeon]